MLTFRLIGDNNVVAVVFSRQQKLEKVMDQEGLADEEVSNSNCEYEEQGGESTGNFLKTVGGTLIPPRQLFLYRKRKYSSAGFHLHVEDLLPCLWLD